MQNSLEKAFKKAFELIFLKGTSIIEKTYNKENIKLDFEADNYVVEKLHSKKSIRRMEKKLKGENILTNVATTASGFGMGFIGMGLPDIPLFVGTLLRTIYDIGLHYGYQYEEQEEKIYILRLIQTALSNEDEKHKHYSKLCNIRIEETTLNTEIITTSKVLSDTLLVEKFVQGIPIIGCVGGVVNYMVFNRVTKFAMIEYKIRYLEEKLN